MMRRRNAWAVSAVVIAGIAIWLGHGPAAQDLIEWAAFNHNGATPLLVQVLTSAAPGQALANLLRLFHTEHPEAQGPSALEQELSRVGQPPPRTAPQQPSEINRSISSGPSVGQPPPR